MEQDAAMSVIPLRRQPTSRQKRKAANIAGEKVEHPAGKVLSTCGICDDESTSLPFTYDQLEKDARKGGTRALRADQHVQLCPECKGGGQAMCVGCARKAFEFNWTLPVCNCSARTVNLSVLRYVLLGVSSTSKAPAKAAALQVKDFRQKERRLDALVSRYSQLNYVTLDNGEVGTRCGEWLIFPKKLVPTAPTAPTKKKRGKNGRFVARTPEYKQESAKCFRCLKQLQVNEDSVFQPFKPCADCGMSANAINPYFRPAPADHTDYTGGMLRNRSITKDMAMDYLNRLMLNREVVTSCPSCLKPIRWSEQCNEMKCEDCDICFCNYCGYADPCCALVDHFGHYGRCPRYAKHKASFDLDGGIARIACSCTEDCQSHNGGDCTVSSHQHWKSLYEASRRATHAYKFVRSMVSRPFYSSLCTWYKSQPELQAYMYLY